MKQQNMSIDQFAVQEGVSIRTAFRWIADGVGPETEKLGNKTYITPEAYAQWLKKKERHSEITGRQLRRPEVEEAA